MDNEPKCPHCGKTVPPGTPLGICPECLLKAGADSQGPGAQAADLKFEPPTPAALAAHFPQLEILEFIGQGGMGAVYKARQPALDRLVALKILSPKMDEDPGFAERFSREARTLAKLSHPNIVAVYDFGQTGGYRYFVMEYVDGLNLRQLERTTKLSPREALGIIPQLCEALQFAHDAGVVHRDIKPENILVDKRGRVKIADFGLAKLLGPGTRDYTITEAGHVMGTPHYMAPEQVEKPLEVDHRADIYSLGVVFYEMLTGELPLGRFASPSQKVQVDVRLDDVVLRALEKEPERRYQQASQVKSAVETISSTPGGAPKENAATAFFRGFTKPETGKAEAMWQEISARNYQLDIGSCLSRGWALVKSDFWPMVATTALIVVLLSVLAAASSNTYQSSENQGTHVNVNMGSGVVYMLVVGPLEGGLAWYFLRKIRKLPADVKTPFSVFAFAFLDLFLAAFVCYLLTFFGFLFCLLPGIYLWVAWRFTLALVVDKRLDFWSAMELSRKTISRQWWSFFGFAIVLGLLYIAGLLAFCVGQFVAIPITIAAWMYAYEDIFGATAQKIE